MSEFVCVPMPFSDGATEVIVSFPCLYGDRMEGWLGTSDHLGISPTFAVLFESNCPTVWPVSVESPSAFLAEEVSRLRDQIIEISGLTRQEIALAIGVDRRSLSGFARGDIRPTPPRLESLRLLAKVVHYAASRWGERSRQMLLSPRHGRTPLELVAAGDAGVFGVLDSIDAADAAVSTRSLRTKRQPLYLAARNRGRPLDRAGIFREDGIYEQDLADVSSFDEQPAERRRGRIR